MYKAVRQILVDFDHVASPVVVGSCSLPPSQCLPPFQYCVNKISLTPHHSSLHHVSHISQADKIPPDLLLGGS